MGGKVAPWPSLGHQWFHLGYFRGPCWEPFLINLLILFRDPQSLDFAIPCSVFAGFSHPKSSHFGYPFSITFSTPFWDPLWKSHLAHLGPQRCRPCLPMSILDPFWDPPWGPKWTSWRSGAPQNRAQKGSWKRPVSARVPESRSYRFWGPLGWPKRPFGTPLGDTRCVVGTPLGDR